MPPRVTFVAPFGLARKGTTRARVLPLAVALAARGWPVRVLIPSWDVPAEWERRYSLGEAEVVHLPQRRRLGVAAQGQIAVELLRESAAGHPQIVHCFKPIGYAGALAWWLRRQRDAGRWQGRIVVDSDDLEGRGGWADAGGHAPWQRALRDWQEKSTIRAADLVTVASQYLEARVGEWAGAHKRLMYLPNAGVRPALSDAPPTGAAPATPTLLLYSRFNEFEPRRVARIVGDILQLVPAARLLIVGDAANSAASVFLGALRVRGLAARVDVAGELVGEERDARLASATVALWSFDDTPINRARSPAKLLDLLWLGKAVVAEAVGEVPALAGAAAVLVPAGAEKAMTAAAARLLTEAGERCALEQAALASRRERGGWEARAVELADAYEALSPSYRCGGGRRRRR